MSFFAALGDDDHTAADGPYARLMKVRKWLFIIGGAAVLLTSNLYNPAALTGLLKFVELPVWLVGQSIAAGLLYLIVQYAALSYQLNRTYDIVLEERLIYRRADEVTKSSTAADAARSALQQHRNAIIEEARTRLNDTQVRLETSRANAERYVTSAQRNMLSEWQQADDGKKLDPKEKTASLLGSLQEFSASSIRESAAQMLAAQRDAEDDVRAARRHYDEIRQATWLPSDTQSQALYSAVERANRELENVQKMNPADRNGYRAAEKALDWLRLLPPPLFAIISLVKLAQFAL